MRETVKPLIAFLTLLAVAAGVHAYPLDGYEPTGITRLRAYQLAKDWMLYQGLLVPGSLWTLDDVELRLADAADFTLPEPDPALGEALAQLVGEDAEHYGISVLDLSDRANPRFAELNGTKIQNPGSVGKVVVVLAWFQALADRFPEPADRVKFLRETTVTANVFVQGDHHVVPVWKPGDASVIRRPVREGDEVSLYTWLDWTCSASSNAGASMLMSELVLLRQFGEAYPPTPAEAAAWFEKTPKAELQRRLGQALQEPLRRNGLDPAKLRQGSLFTRKGKELLPGTNSVSTARELLRFMLLMEQGKLVDAWSSLEIKRLLYLTDTRVRYASADALDESALYFKSGSLYGCKPEKGFKCDKFMGNRINFMNSVTVVETHRDGRDLHYVVSILSNVLRKDSALVHREFGEELHRRIEAFHAASDPTPTPPAP
jgi:hypothetical protein